MKIIVTGGAGFIGSAVIRQAIADGHNVVNIDCLTYAANLNSLASVADNPNYVFEKLDINDGPAMMALFERHEPDAIMHLAAESHVDRSIDNPGTFIQTNVIGTFNLFTCRSVLLEWIIWRKKGQFPLPSYFDRRGLWRFGTG